MLASKESEYKTQQAKIPEFKGYAEEEAPQYKPTGSEQREFLTYVERLGLSPEYAEWLKGQFWMIFDEWGQAKKAADYPMSFLSFANDYLASGGRR